uniref:DNA repair and recombination protein RAD54B n=1 Tax=Spongospora subterranea TaxID=70186 RepID=A0A0H5R814_9EUKA|eukprot:CRZ10273.1 hypothetical protein [Spongospora subterranea]
MRKSAIIASRRPASSNETAAYPDTLVAGSERPIKKIFRPPRLHGSSSLQRDAAVSTQKESLGPSLAYKIFYSVKSNKKHKKYSDGVLLRKGNNFVIFNDSGKQITSRSLSAIAALGTGSELECGTYEVQVDQQVDIADYESGLVFISVEPYSTKEPVVRSTKNHESKFKSAAACKPSIRVEGRSPKTAVTNSRNNPFALNALVLYKPIDPSAPNSRYVTLCPFISNCLRPHQRDGVSFLYDCLIGKRNPNYFGAILADEMGLGKTLQCISIIWTLLKDGPCGPVVSRALVVVPSSLIDNWVNEFKKWLGNHRLEVLAMQSSLSAKQQKEMLEDFINGTRWAVLIISYEMCRKFSNTLSRMSAIKRGVLLICDEGHRLKNSQGNQTIAALELIGAQRRLIITGTPIQNQLDELYAMCSFVNPGQLSTLDSFRNNFIKPISAWRDSGTACSADDATLGQKRADTLKSLTSSFILRRTSDVLSKYLPSKTQCVVFCRLSALQIKLYQTYVESQAVKTSINVVDTAAVLKHITALRKLVNDPSLVSDLYDAAHLPDNYDCLVSDPANSTKMNFLDSLLTRMNTEDPPGKLVIVSNFTKTLQCIEKLCQSKSISILRLDGQTPSQARQGIVNRFNDSHSLETVFLLSAKAGGCGLNLIGASRLVLFDPDWNPATDEQAMARIWRDGQLYPCVIYRLLTTGGIDEKIFQRQLTKQELAMVIEGKDRSVPVMARDELKKLFMLSCNEEYCQTLSMFLDVEAIGSTWNFHRDLSTLDDPVFTGTMELLPPGTISFAMSKTTSFES